MEPEKRKQSEFEKSKDIVTTFFFPRSRGENEEGDEIPLFQMVYVVDQFSKAMNYHDIADAIVCILRAQRPRHGHDKVVYDELIERMENVKFK